MEITINGEKKSFAAPLTITELLEHLGINPKSVAVERNLKIVARDQIKTEITQDGDVFEIIKIVGGG